MDPTYMDDSIKSCETEEELVEKIWQIIPSVHGINMDICKFYTNSNEALKILDKNKVSTKVKIRTRHLHLI